MKIAIIGCGLIGEKRAKALSREHDLVITADTNIKRAEYVASINKYNAKAVTDWKLAVEHNDVDVVIIATSNNWLTPIGIYALENKKHVLIEKPGARSSLEIKEFLNKAKNSDKLVKVGFNLRYHPAMLKAKEILETGELGELMFLRGRYGHGGRIGYDKEWRANEDISGGGELVDQGVHLIDLSRWAMGEEFVKVEGFSKTYYWDMPVDDNGFVSMRTENDQMAWLHASCSEWKNLFCFEIYGKKGKLQIDGLGGSYGTERLTYYKMLPEMGPPPTYIWEYPGADNSWEMEFNAFTDSINRGTKLNGDLNDAYEALKVVDIIYRREI